MIHQSFQIIRNSYIRQRRVSLSGDGVGISARSDGTVNVQKIMESLDGGGHYSAAATELEEKTIEEAKELLESKLEGFIGDTRISE